MRMCPRLFDLLSQAASSDGSCRREERLSGEGWKETWLGQEDFSGSIVVGKNTSKECDTG